MDNFEAIEIATPETTIFLRKGGKGPAVLLLHGFPQTHLMWREVAPLLANDLTVVCADLRGYGQSGCPPSDAQHSPYSKRTMAADMVAVMEQLGFPRFSVAGHDRGGRVAYRLALDHPGRIKRLSLLDIVPTAEVWDRADKKFADAFWPWNLLSQPAPLPEKLIGGAPEAIIDNALHEWGSPGSIFPGPIRAAYMEQLRNPERVHAICEEYRAAATLDYQHDVEDRQMNNRITCPLLVLWTTGSPLDSWYTHEGGPTGLWKKWADTVLGKSMKGGHFFAEEHPGETAAILGDFFSK